MAPGKSFLLVDQSRDLPARLERAIRQMDRGAGVFTLPTGERALQHLLQCGERWPLPDVVLLDRHMPDGMDGPETLRHIRRVERLVGLPVLIIAGSDDADHVAAAREAGADGYMRKPVVHSEVETFARAVLGWRREESWRESGPALAGSCLVACETQVRSSAVGALEQSFPFAVSLPQDPSFAQGLLNFVQWCRDTARAAVDPFQLAFTEACARHKITPSQARRLGGSHRLVGNRRATAVDLIIQGWPDETILDVFPFSESEMKRLHKAARESEMKRLHKAAREKVGPNMDRLLN